MLAEMGARPKHEAGSLNIEKIDFRALLFALRSFSLL